MAYQNVRNLCNLRKESMKYFKPLMIYLLIIILVSVCTVVSIIRFNLLDDYITCDAEIVEKIIEKETKVEVVKFVEKSKTQTHDFLLHLNPDVDPELAIIIAKAIDESSAKYRLPRKLVCSIIMKESAINPFAISKVGAIGLMQIMSKIHKEKHVDTNLWHIAVNVDVGCQIFREYLDLEHGNMYKTFHRYLSRNATKEQIKNYSSDIYGNWAKLEMFDYLSIEERKNQTEEPKETKDEEIMGEGFHAS